MSVAWVRLHAILLVVALMIVSASLAQASHVLNHGKRDYDSEISYYKGLAESGDVEAQEALALIYSEAATKPGLTVRETPPQTQNYVEALRLLEPLVEAKRPKAMARLAVLEAFGLGTPVDNDHALSFARATAEAGEPEAQWLMARFAFSGKGVEKSRSSGEAWLQKAIAQGYSPALVDLATLWLNDAERHASLKGMAFAGLTMVELALDMGEERAAKLLFVPRDFKSSAPRAYVGDTPLLDQNVAPRHPAFMHYLGMLHLYGWGVPKSDDEALRWLNWAAGEGYAPAQRDLAEFYLSGPASYRDEAMATKWFKEAASNGEPHAMAVHCLNMLRGLRKVPQDIPRSLSLCAEAGEAGAAEAFRTLGNFYGYGDAPPSDPVRAFSYFLQGAERGDPRAQNDVARRYSSGEGVAADHGRSVMWARRAASQGDPDAAQLLGQKFLNGDGVEKDLDEAILWLTIFARSKPLFEDDAIEQMNRQDAVEQVEGIAAQLSPDRRERAAALAAAFRPEPEKPPKLPPGFVPWN